MILRRDIEGEINGGAVLEDIYTYAYILPIQTPLTLRVVFPAGLETP